jgi:hypothetical protein
MSSVPPPPPPPEPVPPAAQPPVEPPAPGMAAPDAQPASGSSSKLAIIVVVGIIVTLVVLAGALVALFSTLNTSFNQPGSDGGDTPPVVENAPPCDGCLTLDDAFQLRTDGIPTLALEPDADAGYAKPSVVGSYADSSSENFLDGGGTPLFCSFAIDYSPVSPSSPDDTNRADRIGDLGSYFNDTDYVSMVVRVFESESDAAAYPDTLRSGIADCPHYSFSFSEGEEFWETDVDALEFETSSPAVTAVGWHENSGGSDLIIVDVQYSNLAVRTVYSRTADSSGTEEQFRAFVLELSAALEELG